MRSTFYLCLAILFAAPFATQAQMWPTETLRDNISGAWTRSADFDQDGDPDILVQAGDSIYWYENLRPGWAPHLIDPTFYDSKLSYLDVLDLDGDGDPDVLKAPASADGVDSLSWNENRQDGTEWIKHNLKTIDGDLGWLQRSYGDLDGDGDVDLVVPEVDFANTPSLANLYWLENEGNNGSWAIHTLKAGNHWYSSLADMDDDGDLDVVASWAGLFWLENRLPETEWTLHTVLEATIGTHFVGVCSDMNGDGQADIVSGPSHANGGMVYYTNADWQETVINPATQLYVGPVGDIDGDGDPDIAYGGAGYMPQALGWAENQDNGTDWVLHDITSAQIIQRIPTGLDDIDGDGDMDIVSLTFDVNTGIGSALWFANPLVTTSLDEPSHLAAWPSPAIWPNPFSTTTTIEYVLPEAGAVKCTIHNLLGQPVRTLVQEGQRAGKNTLSWDGKTDSGAQAFNGMYTVRIEMGERIVAGTVVLKGK